MFAYLQNLRNKLYNFLSPNDFCALNRYLFKENVKFAFEMLPSIYTTLFQVLELLCNYISVTLIIHYYWFLGAW